MINLCIVYNIYMTGYGKFGLYIYIYIIFFIHSSLDAHLGCFHVLAVVNDSAVSMRMQISL